MEVGGSGVLVGQGVSVASRGTFRGTLSESVADGSGVWVGEMVILVAVRSSAGFVLMLVSAVGVTVGVFSGWLKYMYRPTPAADSTPISTAITTQVNIHLFRLDFLLPDTIVLTDSALVAAIPEP